MLLFPTRNHLGWYFMRNVIFLFFRELHLTELSSLSRYWMVLNTPTQQQTNLDWFYFSWLPHPKHLNPFANITTIATDPDYVVDGLFNTPEHTETGQTGLRPWPLHSGLLLSLLLCPSHEPNVKMCIWNCICEWPHVNSGDDMWWSVSSPSSFLVPSLLFNWDP